MVNRVTDFLKEWTSHYIKNKDILTRKLKNIEVKESELFVHFEHKEHLFIIEPIIKSIDVIMDKVKKEKEKNDKLHVSLIVLNSKVNFKIVSGNWKKLIKNPLLSIYFINPFSELDKKWIVFPYTHNKIAEESSIEKGLKALFLMVEPTNEKIILSKIK